MFSKVLPTFSHTYLEALAPAQNQVAQRYANVVVDDLAMSLRCIVVSEYLHRADDFHAWRVGRYDDDALLAVAVRVIRIALAKDEVHCAARVASTGDPPMSW